MALIISIFAGWLVFWVLFCVWIWGFGTERDVWPLALMFVAHWLIYFVFMALPGYGNQGTALGWFLIGPIVGVFGLARSAGGSVGRPLVFVQVALNALIVSGAAIPLTLGAIYLPLRVALSLP